MSLAAGNANLMHVQRFAGNFVGLGETVDISFDGDGLMVQTMASGDYSLASINGDKIELPIRFCWHPRGGYTTFRIINTGTNPTAPYDVLCWTGQLFPVPL